MAAGGARKVTYFTDQRGMTLAEVLVAVVIIMTALLALASGIPIASYGIQEGSQLSTATFLANQRLEQVKASAWTSTPAADNVGVSASATAAPQAGGVTTFPDENPVAAPYTQFIRQVRITNCGAGAGCSGIVDAGMRQITVTVSYQPMTGVGVAAAGSTKSAIVTMLVAQR
jgi:prepilin-type N-terminal cleavage/methylation domain-containing protein